MKKIILIIFGLFIIPNLALAQETPAERLENSPRHQEWVKIKQGDRIVHAFLVFPEIKDKAPAVIVIHENRGLNDWVLSIADRIAEAGYIAIAPDLLSGMGPSGGKTSDFPDRNAARDAIYSLTPEQVTADLNATADYVKNLSAANGTIAVSGFCWGGSQTFRFATNRKDLAAAYVFYGSAPKLKAELEKIQCPVYGFYGGNDARVTSTIPETAELMKAAKKTFEPIVYEAARHGFMRAGEAADASEANIKAVGESWKRWKVLLKKL